MTAEGIIPRHGRQRGNPFIVIRCVNRCPHFINLAGVALHRDNRDRHVILGIAGISRFKITIEPYLDEALALVASCGIDFDERHNAPLEEVGGVLRPRPERR
jgi:hypothetical protein